MRDHRDLTGSAIIPLGVLYDPKLSMGAKLTCAAYTSFIGGPRPTTAQLAEIVGRSEAAVEAFLVELHQAGAFDRYPLS